MRDLATGMNARTSRRILGIDPVLRITGFGVIAVTGQRIEYVTCGCIRSAGDDLPGRIAIILRDLGEVIGRSAPT